MLNFSYVLHLCFVGILFMHKTDKNSQLLLIIRHRHLICLQTNSGVLYCIWDLILMFAMDLIERENLKVLTMPLLSNRINECWTSLILSICSESSALLNYLTT